MRNKSLIVLGCVMALGFGLTAQAQLSPEEIAKLGNELTAMGAIKAISAARMALRGSGEHFVSLDQVIRTMRDTGRDMQDKYKETARGGLAVNIIEC